MNRTPVTDPDPGRGPCARRRATREPKSPARVNRVQVPSSCSRRNCSTSADELARRRARRCRHRDGRRARCRARRRPRRRSGPRAADVGLFTSSLSRDRVVDLHPPEVDELVETVEVEVELGELSRSARAAHAWPAGWAGWRHVVRHRCPQRGRPQTPGSWHASCSTPTMPVGPSYCDGCELEAVDELRVGRRCR